MRIFQRFEVWLLLIVGGIALLGAVPYALRGLVDFRNVLFFGLPGMAGTYLGAWLSRFVSGQVQLLTFALVMLLAAYFMARPLPLRRQEGASFYRKGGSEGDWWRTRGTGSSLAGRGQPVQRHLLRVQ